MEQPLKKTDADDSETTSSKPGVSLEDAHAGLVEGAKFVFRDPRVRSFGISRYGNAYGYRAVRNSAMIVPQVAHLAAPLPVPFAAPITYVDTDHEIEHLLQVPYNGPGAPTVGSHVLEQDRNRPLVSGLQIQNYDDDIRTGAINQGYIVIGTLGCFVDLANGSVAILSNNHVLAGENRGVMGGDRIQQPGGSALNAADFIATLTNFIALQPSPQNATLVAGNVVFNQVDAAVAELVAGAAYNQGFLPSRALTAPAGVSAPQVGDKVFKVGRTTGLTFGEVKDVATIVGPIAYDPGPCWFQQSITIEGDNGTMFSDKGDSGSMIVRTSDSQAVGLLYAGNGTQTYACPMPLVMNALQCTLH